MIQQHQKPLSYPTKKAVMQFFEANFRTKLCVHSPALSIVDRAAPLQIRHLVLDHNITQINDTSYTFAIYREYPIGTAPPRLHQRANDNGTVDFDLDQWGFRDPSLDDVLYPGDLKLDGAVDKVEPTNDARRRELEQQRRYDIQNLERLETELLPFQCRESNTPPGFTPYLQCTISSPGETKTWRFPPTLKLYQAVRMLRSKLLGSRETIRVEGLEIGMRRKVLRLPELIKFRVRELRILGKFSTTLNDLAPVIERSSFPLEVLEAKFSKLEVHPDFTSAKALTVSNKSSGIFEDFLKVPHRIVHLKYDIFPIEKYLELIRLWTQTGKPIGTRFSFNIKKEARVREIFDTVQFNFEPTMDMESYGMSIRMNQLSVLKIFALMDKGPKIILFFEVVQA